MAHIVGQLQASHVCDVLTKCVLPIHLKEGEGATWGLLASHRSGYPELAPAPPPFPGNSGTAFSSPRPYTCTMRVFFVKYVAVHVHGNPEHVCRDLIWVHVNVRERACFQSVASQRGADGKGGKVSPAGCRR